MIKPIFKYSKVFYAVSAILTIPLLIDMCTACHLFPLWIAWILFFMILGVSIVRLWHAFSQHLYKFAWGLIGQLALGAAVLLFFQLSVNRVWETPVSNPVTPAVVDIVNPFQALDSVHKAQAAKSAEKEATKETHKSEEDKKDSKEK